MLTVEDKLEISNRKDDAGGRPHGGREGPSAAVSSALLISTTASPPPHGHSVLSESNNGSQDNDKLMKPSEDIADEISGLLIPGQTKAKKPKGNVRRKAGVDSNAETSVGVAEVDVVSLLGNVGDFSRSTAALETEWCTGDVFALQDTELASGCSTTTDFIRPVDANGSRSSPPSSLLTSHEPNADFSAGRLVSSALTASPPFSRSTKVATAAGLASPSLAPSLSRSSTYDGNKQSSEEDTVPSSESGTLQRPPVASSASCSRSTLPPGVPKLPPARALKAAAVVAASEEHAGQTSGQVKVATCGPPMRNLLPSSFIEEQGANGCGGAAAAVGGEVSKTLGCSAKRQGNDTNAECGWILGGPGGWPYMIQPEAVKSQLFIGIRQAVAQSTYPFGTGINAWQPLPFQPVTPFVHPMAEQCTSQTLVAPLTEGGTAAIEVPSVAACAASSPPGIAVETTAKEVTRAGVWGGASGVPVAAGAQNMTTGSKPCVKMPSRKTPSTPRLLPRPAGPMVGAVGPGCGGTVGAATSRSSASIQPPRMTSLLPWPPGSLVPGVPCASPEAWGLASSWPELLVKESVVGAQRGEAGTAGTHQMGVPGPRSTASRLREATFPTAGTVLPKKDDGLTTKGGNVTCTRSSSAVIDIDATPGPNLGDKRKLLCEEETQGIDSTGARGEPNAPAGLPASGETAASRTRACDGRELGSGGGGDRDGGVGGASAGSNKQRRIANMTSPGSYNNIKDNKSIDLTGNKPSTPRKLPTPATTVPSLFGPLSPVSSAGTLPSAMAPLVSAAVLQDQVICSQGEPMYRDDTARQYVEEALLEGSTISTIAEIDIESDELTDALKVWADGLDDIWY